MWEGPNVEETFARLGQCLTSCLRFLALSLCHCERTKSGSLDSTRVAITNHTTCHTAPTSEPDKINQDLMSQGVSQCPDTWQAPCVDAMHTCAPWHWMNKGSPLSTRRCKCLVSRPGTNARNVRCWKQTFMSL